MRGFRHTPGKQKEAHYMAIRQFIPLDEVTDEVWLQAASLWADLRKAGKSIGDADTIIAAQCLVNGYTLITHNTSDFQRVSGLKLMDWQA
jgi:tRNA(fMet)-specific endonuclease VapC